MTTTREIEVGLPLVDGQTVRFTWHVTPASELYLRNEFHLTFPSSVQVASIPERLWALVAMICLHAHWALLRPCRVRLPFALDSGEIEFFLRLLDTEVATLEGNSGGSNVARAIALEASVRSLPPLGASLEIGRCAVAFSGGKDSLLQAGLLSELTKNPLLVTTTSPMPPLHDHDTDRRKQLLRDIAIRRPEATLLEVISDFRSCWRNDFPVRLGYGVSVNELTDTFLYLATTLVCAWSFGATHLFLASETEVQENVVIEGRIVQHPHAMYSVVTQRAVESLLAGSGLRYGSLISSLRSFQVQRLLWKRYPDIADLQYSCWRVGAAEKTCSSCSQCLRIAMSALESDEMPERMGIDLVRLMNTMHRWEPSALTDRSLLPGRQVASALHAQSVRAIRRTSVARLASVIATTGLRRLFAPRTLLALVRYAGMRRRLSTHPDTNEPGSRSGYLEFVDPLLRDSVAAIYAEAFPADPNGTYAPMMERTRTLAEWISAPLQISDAKTTSAEATAG